MVKATALYGHPEDPDAFDEHYAKTHVPLVEKIPNLQRFEAAKIVATPDGSELPYYLIAESCTLRIWSSCRGASPRTKARR